MLTVVVRDTPVTQGSFKAVASKSTGRPIVKPSNRAGLPIWRAAVRDATVAAREAFGGSCPDPQCLDSTWDHECELGANPYRHPLQGPVVLAITFTLYRPSGVPKRKPAWPWRKPDTDKLLRSTMDALRAGGAYADDAQVVETLRLAKRYVRPDAPLPDVTDDAKFMLQLGGTELDVLDTPGAVIRIAHLTEFPGIQGLLERAGYEPKDITGGW